MYKSNKGITIIALVITVIIMLILAVVGFEFGSDAIERAKLEDIKTNMISIKTKAKTIQEKYNFKDIENLVGTKLDSDADTEGIQEIIAIPNTLKEQLSLLNINNLYVWNQENLNSQGLSSIKADNDKFYIVYYNIEENTCEIYYSKGYNDNGTIKYSLTELKEIP